MPDLSTLLADLAAEGDSLDALVAPLPDWTVPTPAAGWTVAHQISHLAWTDRQAVIAATDPDAFGEILAAARAERFVEEGAAEGAAEPPAALLERWRTGRREMAAALAAVPAGARLPWFGPPMGAASMATARLMETWAHGQDVADALGAVRAPTARLRHVAHIGVRTRDFAYLNRGLEAPADAFRVVLTGPDGEEWTWGPEDAAQSVTGPALDFCLLVTQRRNRADLAVTARGADADRWLGLAQAFAGPPGGGRPPRG
ncbi:TIGR03084 family metal-binding protein [Actinomadura rugatobispora]|uniref:TIGR03084 family metal-binding protein n=1 Tax=Actinomadura rugatobispora TaxID=1994 RepID=A0ABW0ZV52_9ACTN|nr:TIGR03084 family metal-binding protein [Actinomadura rugatobispora]